MVKVRNSSIFGERLRAFSEKIFNPDAESKLELENLSISCECGSKCNVPEDAEEGRKLALVEHVELIDDVGTLLVYSR